MFVLSERNVQQTLRYQSQATTHLCVLNGNVLYNQERKATFAHDLPSAKCCSSCGLDSRRDSGTGCSSSGRGSADSIASEGIVSDELGSEKWTFTCPAIKRMNRCTEHDGDELAVVGGVMIENGCYIKSKIGGEIFMCRSARDTGHGKRCSRFALPREVQEQ